MEFRVLGPLEVLDGERPVTLPGGRARALLALLILRAGEVVSTERLVDELWGEVPPPTVTTALQGLVSTLRKRLAKAATNLLSCALRRPATCWPSPLRASTRTASGGCSRTPGRLPTTLRGRRSFERH
ncbi:MAG: AfsR/SARP family transcriptional regulator [Actinomycetota bacterium]